MREVEKVGYQNIFVMLQTLDGFILKRDEIEGILLRNATICMWGKLDEI
jgi:hypothetical protein